MAMDEAAPAGFAEQGLMEYHLYSLGRPATLLDNEQKQISLLSAKGTSVRTLQRRLKDAGVNYSDLQNDVRKTLALNLLENETLALAEIAFSLGYSEVSAFNHAFRRWVGQSPGDYRRLRAVHFKSAAAKKSEPPARGSI